jgi:hypothetical protein
MSAMIPPEMFEEVCKENASLKSQLEEEKKLSENWKASCEAEHRHKLEIVAQLEQTQNLLNSSVKWIDRIVNRRDDLPLNFFDNCDPGQLAKEIRAALERSKE